MCHQTTHQLFTVVACDPLLGQGLKWVSKSVFLRYLLNTQWLVRVNCPDPPHQAGVFEQHRASILPPAF